MGKWEFIYQQPIRTNLATPKNVQTNERHHMINAMTYTQALRLFQDLVEIGTPDCLAVAEQVMAHINNITLQSA
jgi:hypothetical protein